MPFGPTDTRDVAEHIDLTFKIDAASVTFDLQTAAAQRNCAKTGSSVQRLLSRRRTRATVPIIAQLPKLIHVQSSNHVIRPLVGV
jgi:hypothetical protein